MPMSPPLEVETSTLAGTVESLYGDYILGEELLNKVEKNEGGDGSMTSTPTNQVLI